jgi:hypothetical protein
MKQASIDLSYMQQEELLDLRNHVPVLKRDESILIDAL